MKLTHLNQRLSNVTQDLNEMLSKYLVECDVQLYMAIFDRVTPHWSHCDSSVVGRSVIIANATNLGRCVIENFVASRLYVVSASTFIKRSGFFSIRKIEYERGM